MAALAAFTINNGDATPVAYTFTPTGPDSNGVQWFEQTTPTPTNSRAAARVSASLKRPPVGNSLAGKIATVEFGLWLPFMETVANNSAGLTPAPTLAYEEIFRITYKLPERSTAADRKNLRVLGFNLTANANTLLASMVDNLQALY